MRPQIFLRSPERDEAYGTTRSAIITSFLMQEAARDNAIRPDQASNRRESSLRARRRAYTVYMNGQRSTGDTQGDDELMALVSSFDSIMETIQTLTPPSASNDTQIASSQHLRSLIATARADFDARIDRRENAPDEQRNQREFEEPAPDPRMSWRRLEEIYELSRSLGLHRMNSVERLDEDCLTEDSFPKSVVERLEAACRPFECPLCFEAMSNPIIIVPCGHILCKPCLEGMHRVARSDGKQMTCHFCRERLGTYTYWEHVRKVYGLQDQNTNVKTVAAKAGQGEGQRVGIVGRHLDIDVEKGNKADGVVERATRGFQGCIGWIRAWFAQACRWFMRAVAYIRV
jgi:hypothetical protein